MLLGDSRGALNLGIKQRSEDGRKLGIHSVDPRHIYAETCIDVFAIPPYGNASPLPSHQYLCGWRFLS